MRAREIQQRRVDAERTGPVGHVTEDAATLIMSAGVVQPGSDAQKRTAALAGMANAARVANSATALQPAPAKVKVD